MAETDVTYADVRFKRQRAKGEIPAADAIYSAIRTPETKEPVCPKCAADVQQAGESMRSKVTSERVILLALIAILVVTIIALTVNETCLRCESGWEQHGGKCYYFNTKKSSWNESRRSCVDQGGDLVKIDSREEQMFLVGRLSNMTEDNREDMFWIGLTDSEEEGKWFWVDGSPLNESLSFWGDGQPDNKSLEGATEADCVRIGNKGRSDYLKSWFDRSCNDLQKSICEKTAGQSSCVCV